MRPPLCRTFSSLFSLRNFCLDFVLSGKHAYLMAGLFAAVFFHGAVLPAQTANRITQAIDPAQVRALPNHHPLWANSANGTGALPADQTLDHLTLVLSRSTQQQAAFEQFLAGQLNPASPDYHHWLTPNEVGDRFGLSDDDVATISGWLQSQGLHVNWVSPSRIFIGFGGTAANLNRAFQTELQYFNVNGAQRMSVASDPMIPAAVAPAIKAVRGLYTPDEHPLHQVNVVQSNSPEATTSGGTHYIAPGDFATIYDVPASYTGAGVTIGIVSWSRVNTADLDNFRLKTGATFSNPTVVIPTALGGIDPGPALTAPPGSGVSTGAQGEATLDVLRAGSTAPGANLLLVAATPASGGLEVDAQYMVQTTPVPVQVMNISFGGCELQNTQTDVNFWDTLFQQAASEGISVFVYSGDSGASGCDDAFAAPPVTPLANSPNYICSSSYATCVGGTQFNDTASPTTYWNTTNSAGLKSALSYIPEGGWNESTITSVAATGGGVSAFIPTPSWQTGTGVPAARKGRYTPDVSFSGASHDGYFACFAAVTGGSCVTSGTSFGFVAFAGTSASAPAMAGVAALLDQKLGSAQGNLNPGIYRTAGNFPAAFHDATVATSGVSGCSVNTSSICNNSIPSPTSLTGGQPGFLLTAGYDEVTGLGSLDIATFINNYSTASVNPKFTVSGTTVTVAAGATTGNSSTITVTPSGGFTGPVALTAVLATSPTGAVHPPTFSFGATTPVSITGASAGTATLTISTTATTTAALTYPPRPGARWYPIGGAALAGILLFCIPARRRSWRNMLGMIALLVALTCGVVACGGGGGAGSSGTITISGTTPGAYTITVTATSGAITSPTTISLTVQ